MSIKHDHTLNPVTALEFLSEPSGRLLILVGEGAYLKILEAKSSRLVSQFHIFNGQTVHGIVAKSEVEGENDLQIVIWGGSSLILLSKLQFNELLSQGVGSILDLVTISSDWILDVAISPYNNNACVIVTAHNTVSQARLVSNSSHYYIETLQSPSRSILYSAHIVWESPSSILVAAGTVFGEIITWDSSIIASGSCQVIATFTGHEGSIFGVNISPPILDSAGRITRLLASCSDDRTIRIWDIYGSARLTDEKRQLPTLDFEGARETGFVRNGQVDGIQKVVEGCLAMVMGHASRIWRVLFQVTDQESKFPALDVFSFGEDSTAQHWRLNLGVLSHSTSTQVYPQSLIKADSNTIPRNATAFVHLNTFAYHSGKHIFSTAMKQYGDLRQLLATGGADGKISFYEIPSIAMEIEGKSVHPNTSRNSHLPISKSVQTQVWDPQNILQALPNLPSELDFHSTLSPMDLEPDDPAILLHGNQPKKKSKKIPIDTINRYSFVSKNDILFTTNFGRVLLAHMNEPVSWNELQLPDSGKEDLKSYSVIKGVPELGLAIMGASNGNIYMYSQPSSIKKIAQVGGKVVDIFPVFDSDTELGFVATTLGISTATLFTSDLSKPFSVRVATSITFTIPNKFVVTSVSKSTGEIIFGSRNGSVAAISITGQDERVSVWSPEHADAGDAITSITFLPTPSELDVRYFITTGRNGIYSIFAITTINDEHSPSIHLRPVHHGTPPLGPNIEHAWFSGTDLMLYGFRSKNFIVWNETQQCEIMNVECGGAHRSYAYSPRHGNGGFFIYTKASKLYLHGQPKPSHDIIKPGGHGREIKACAVLSNKGLVATGAEDTAIRIWRYHNSSFPLENKFESQAVIQKHSTGIQCLQFHTSGYLFSSGGNEEFFVWALYSIPGFGVGVVCEASCPDQSEERDLRIMSFDVSDICSAEDKNTSSELLISLALSDSTVRTYRYSKAFGFRLMAKGIYTSACLMQIKHIKTTWDRVYLLTSATDGNLVMWKSDISPLPAAKDMKLKILSTYKLHQSSIKCLEIKYSSSGEYILIATGGDDNALGITLYSTHSHPVAIKSIILRSAHAAAVTGLSFSLASAPHVERAVSDEEFRIVSSSNDQRVKEWLVKVSCEYDVELRKVGDVFTSVADVGDVVFIGDDMSKVGKFEPAKKKMLVVGNGMEVFEVSVDA